VDILVDQFVDGTEAEFLLLTKEEQVEKLQERQDILNREIELSNKRYERDQQNHAARLERVNMGLQPLPKQKRVVNNHERRQRRRVDIRGLRSFVDVSLGEVMENGG
jgi:hypothetical protein